MRVRGAAARGWGAVGSLRDFLSGAVSAEPWIAALVVATAVVYSAYSVIRHDHFHSGFDLGIFTQAIGHYSHFEAPASTIRGVGNLLGDHFHPILVVLAPLFWIWSDARALLIAQAALAAASIVPVYLFARPRLGRPGAHFLALAYASFWGLQNGVGYDFHELAFAPLLIALAILFIDRRRWTAYFITLALLLCVKEDLAVVVAFLGLYLLVLGKVGRGLITLAAGIVWYELATQVFIPHFSGGVAFAYWNYPQFGHNLGDAVVHVLSAPWKPFEVMFDHRQKVDTILYLFLPFLGLTLCSRIAILAVPLLAEQFLSASPVQWDPNYHHMMTIAPVLAMGAAAGLANVTRLAGDRVRARVATVVPATMVLSGVLVAWFGIPASPLRDMSKLGFYRDPPYAAAVRRALDHLPARGGVLAPEFLVSHLAPRARVYDIGPGVGNAEYFITGLVQEVGSNLPGGSGTYRDYQQGVAPRLPLYQPIYYDDGWIVLRLRPRGVNSGTNGVLRPLPRASANRIARINKSWQGAFTQTFVGLFRCTLRLQRHDPAATSCFSGTGSALFAAQAELDPELAAALPGLTGGCAQLGELARTGARDIVLDIKKLRQAGVQGSIPTVYRVAAGATGDFNELDLAGRLNRFLLLCYPRPFPRP